MEGAFRKVDIDIYDEDVLQETELYAADPRDPAAVLDDAKQRQTAGRSLLAKCVAPLTPARSSCGGAAADVHVHVPAGTTSPARCP